jgi:transposase
MQSLSDDDTWAVTGFAEAELGELRRTQRVVALATGLGCSGDSQSHLSVLRHCGHRSARSLEQPCRRHAGAPRHYPAGLGRARGEEMIDAIHPYDEIAQAAMDKAYDSHATRAKLVAKGIEPVIPPKANRLEIIVYDKEQYKQQNKVERLFNKLKQFRRVATRYEKLKATFLAFVTLTLIIIMLR